MGDRATTSLPIGIPGPNSNSGSSINCIHCPCTNEEYTVLIFTKDFGLRLAGAFSFQVLYGTVEANGYIFVGKKYGATNFVPVSLPCSQIPFSFKVRDDLMDNEVPKERVVSRLREFLNDPQSVMKFVGEKYPVVILLIKHQGDPSSKFVQQQYTVENIFVPKLPHKKFAGSCYEVPFPNINLGGGGEPMELHQPGHPNLQVEYRSVHARLVKETKTKKVSRIVITGNKGVGKSTMMRYLVNALNSLPIEKPEMQPCRVFLLDTDVGQSELNQPGCLALHEIKRPLLGASFASQERSLQCGYFFGSNSPANPFEFYLAIVKRLLNKFAAIAGRDANESFVLFVNTVGWIEDLGYELMYRLLKAVVPTLLINIEVEGTGTHNFIVPHNYKPVLFSVKRATNLGSQPIKPAVLRDFLVAGYFAQCFGLQTQSSPKLRLAALSAYRVRFPSVALYFHPELHHVTDRFVLSALNCMVVALCAVEEGYEECFERTTIFDRDDLPSRLTPMRPDDDEDSEEMYQFLLAGHQPFPMLRCFGHGFIRAISPERKVFYVITPVEEELLSQVTVLAVGHTLLTPEILLKDPLSIEPAPYLIELNQMISLDRDHQKLYSPLRNVTAVRRAMSTATNFTQRTSSRSVPLQNAKAKHSTWNSNGGPPPQKKAK